MMRLLLLAIFILVGCSKNNPATRGTGQFPIEENQSLDGKERDGSTPDHSFVLLEKVKLDLIAKLDAAKKLNELSDEKLASVIKRINNDRKGIVELNDVNLAFIKNMLTNIRVKELYQFNKKNDGIRSFIYGNDSEPYIEVTSNFFKQYESYTETTTPEAVKIEIQRKMLHEISHLWGVREQPARIFSGYVMAILKEKLEMNRALSINDFPINDVMWKMNNYGVLDLWANTFTADAKAIKKHFDNLIVNYDFIYKSRTQFIKQRVFNNQDRLCIEIDTNSYNPKKLSVINKFTTRFYTISGLSTAQFGAHASTDSVENIYHKEKRYTLYDIGFRGEGHQPKLLVFDHLGDVYIEKSTHDRNSSKHVGNHNNKLVTSYVYCSDRFPNYEEVEKSLSKLVETYRISPILSDVVKSENYFKLDKASFKKVYTTTILNIKSTFDSILNNISRGKVTASMKYLKDNGQLNKCLKSSRSERTEVCTNVSLKIIEKINETTTGFNQLFVMANTKAYNELKVVQDPKRIEAINENMKKIEDFYNSFKLDAKVSEFEKLAKQECSKSSRINDVVECYFNSLDEQLNTKLPAWVEQEQFQLKFDELINEIKEIE